MPVGTEKRYLRFSAIVTDRPIISLALKKTGLPGRLVVYHNGTAVIERSSRTLEEGGRGKGEGGKGRAERGGRKEMQPKLLSATCELSRIATNIRHLTSPFHLPPSPFSLPPCPIHTASVTVSKCFYSRKNFWKRFERARKPKPSAYGNIAGCEPGSGVISPGPAISG